MAVALIPVLRNLPQAFQNEIQAHMSQIDLEPGKVLFREGDTEKSIYFITDGIVKVVRFDAEDEEQILAVLHAGEFFGEVSFIDDKPRSATVIAQTKVKLYKLEYQHLAVLMQKYPAEMIKVLMDVFSALTERLRQTNDQLMRLIQISQQAQKASEELKKNILGIISHELRTPLTVIKSSSQLLQFDEITPQQRQFLEMIDRQSTHLNRLVDGLLTLSSIQHGRLALKKSRFNVVDKLVTVCDNMNARAGERNITIRKEHPYTAEVFGDPILIAEMISCVLDNAIKFNKKNGEVDVILRMLTQQEAEELGWILLPNECDGVTEIIVKDTGIGIAQEDFKNIFKPFWQADISATRQHGGAGIGLSFTKEIVLAHQGRIELESELNHGSTFRIYIPSLTPMVG